MRITFGERLSQLLKDDYLTADALSKEIGVSFSIAAQWVRENTPAKLFNLLKVAAFFDCSVDYLCGRTDVKGKFSHASSTFPARLIELIETSSETKAAIFSNLGLNRHALYDWRKGTVPLSSQLVKIADYFNVTVDYLIGID